MAVTVDWLVIDVIEQQPTILGGPLVTFGRAAVDIAGNMLILTTPSGGREVTSIGGADVRCLARRLLREMRSA